MSVSDNGPGPEEPLRQPLVASDHVPWPKSQQPELIFLAEGAANILYRVHPNLTVSLEHAPSNKVPQAELGLLRLRKVPPRESEYNEVRAGHELWRLHIAPHFAKENVVQQCVIEIPPSVFQAANLSLQQDESRGKRLLNRCGTFLDENQKAGLLVTDMTVTDAEKKSSDGLWALEMKPKWLAQSPSAPAGATRCRNCALRMLRASERQQSSEGFGSPANGVHSPISTQTSPPKPSENSAGEIPKRAWCPLRLVHGDIAAIRQVLTILAHQQGQCISDEGLDRTAIHLSSTGIFNRLRDAQVKLDPNGASVDQEASIDLRSAMTLRDCSLLMKVPKNTGKPIEARFGDLDLKSGEKLGKWRQIEDRLIQGGWYTGTGKAIGEAEVCLLAPVEGRI